MAERTNNPRRWLVRCVAVLAGATILGSSVSSGGALVTTKSVVVDNDFDSSPYSETYGIFHAELRPHLGDTFSEGTQGYFAFNLFEGDTPPEPLPLAGVRQELVLTVELPSDLALDRTRHERETTPNWCHGIPPVLQGVIWGGTCRVFENSNGSSVVQIRLQPRREITAADIQLLNDVRIGIGVIGKPGLADGQGKVFAGISLRDGSVPSTPGLVGPARTRLAVVDYRTSGRDRSSLGVWELDLINERPGPGDRFFQNGDTGRLAFQLAPPGLPVRMKTGEQFTVTVAPPWSDSDNHLRILDLPEVCLNPSLYPGFDIDCEQQDPPENGLTIRVERTGTDTDDAFPSGLPILMRLEARLPTTGYVYTVPNVVSLDVRTEQSGSHRPIQNTPVIFWPRRNPVMVVQDLVVADDDGSEFTGGAGEISFLVAPEEGNDDDAPVDVEKRYQVDVELPVNLRQTSAEDGVDEDVCGEPQLEAGAGVVVDSCTLTHEEDVCGEAQLEAGAGVVVESCTLTHEEDATRVTVVFGYSSPDPGEQRFALKVESAAETLLEDAQVSVELTDLSDPTALGSRVEIPVLGATR